MIISYLNNAKNLLSRNASDLLLVGGVSCILGGGLLAIKQTPKALQLIKKKEDENKIELVKTIAPIYIPSILLTGIGITQIVCSRNITNNKIAAITTAYTVTETAYKTYRDKVKEMVEPERYEDIQRAYTKETINRNPVGNKETIMVSGNKVLIYDNSSDRYFEGTINEIERAANTLNKKMRSDMVITLNQFYSEIGLNYTKTGEYLGWHIDRDEIEIYTSSGISEDGRPYVVLEIMGYTAI